MTAVLPDCHGSALPKSRPFVRACRAVHGSLRNKVRSSPGPSKFIAARGTIAPDLTHAWRTPERTHRETGP